MKAPNTKLQAPEKHQTASSKPARARLLMFGVLDFSGAWSLVFGAYYYV
jgi:hypothetical protein